MKAGINDVFPFNSLQALGDAGDEVEGHEYFYAPLRAAAGEAFTKTELREMFCPGYSEEPCLGSASGGGEDRIEWDEQALLAHIHPTGGLTEKSPAYKFLVVGIPASRSWDAGSCLGEEHKAKSAGKKRTKVNNA